MGIVTNGEPFGREKESKNMGKLVNLKYYARLVLDK